MDFISDQTSYINKAPCFWSEVVNSLRFTLIMKSAQLFDESKDAIGLRKVFNILEQSHYREILISELDKAKIQYDTYRVYINEIRTIRDRHIFQQASNVGSCLPHLHNGFSVIHMMKSAGDHQ